MGFSGESEEFVRERTNQAHWLVLPRLVELEKKKQGWMTIHVMIARFGVLTIDSA